MNIQAGEVFQAGGDLAKFFVGEPGFDRGDALQAILQAIQAAWFLQELMGKADAGNGLAQVGIA